MTRNIAECIESVEFSTFFSLNILLFSQVHIMKSYVEKTIDDLSEDLGRPVTLWLMDTQGLEGSHWLTSRVDMTHNNRCTHRWVNILTQSYYYQ